MATFGSGAGFADFVGQEFLNSTPEAAFYARYPSAGKSDPYNQWLKNQYFNYFNRYQAELPKRPNLMFTDFLGEQNPENEFGQLSPFQRGERPSIYAPRTRYIGF